MKRVCVFCGSNFGAAPEYAQATRALAAALVEANLGVVYGGANVGLMGLIAREVLALGGEVIGVLPRALADRELAAPGLSALHLVDSMHERKARMAELSDGFIALPGGLGTLEEFFEVLTWAQLGMHAKPCALLETGDFWRDLLKFLDDVTAAQFIRAEHRAMILCESDPHLLLHRMNAFTLPKVEKWLEREAPNSA